MVLRAPCEKEKKKLVENIKYSEHGLEVPVAKKLVPRAIIYEVHCCISADELT